jgi:hypothetical protein
LLARKSFFQHLKANATVRSAIALPRIADGVLCLGTGHATILKSRRKFRVSPNLSLVRLRCATV